MKKKILGLCMVSAIVMLFCACKANDKGTDKVNDMEKEASEKVDNIMEKMPENTTEYENYISDVCYYGCPNSKRVKKLNLLKRRA